MKSRIDIFLQVISIGAAIAATGSMFLAKAAAFYESDLLSRSESHWFQDSISAFLLSITALLFLLVFRSNKAI